MKEDRNYIIKGCCVKKSCKSCGVIFQSSLLDDEVYCENCRDDNLGDYSYSYNNQYEDIVSDSLGVGSCRTAPVFYD